MLQAHYWLLTNAHHGHQHRRHCKPTGNRSGASIEACLNCKMSCLFARSKMAHNLCYFVSILYFFYSRKIKYVNELLMRIELTIFRLQGECLNPLGHKSLAFAIRILYYTPQIIIVFCL